jgi:hypothetical protein
MNISNVYVAHTRQTQRLPLEVTYDEDGGMGLSPFFPYQRVLVPLPYGGDGWIAEVMDSGGGLATTAATLTRLAHRHAVWGLGGRAAGSERSGSFAGTSSWLESRRDGVDWSYIFNTRLLPAPAPYDLNSLAPAINDVLDHAKL